MLGPSRAELVYIPSLPHAVVPIVSRPEGYTTGLLLAVPSAPSDSRTDFNNDSIHRYDIPTGAFTEFPTPAGSGNTDPLDVAVAQNGIAWFTEEVGQIGHLDPATGIIT